MLNILKKCTFTRILLRKDLCCTKTNQSLHMLLDRWSSGCTYQEEALACPPLRWRWQTWNWNWNSGWHWKFFVMFSTQKNSQCPRTSAVQGINTTYGHGSKGGTYLPPIWRRKQMMAVISESVTAPGPLAQGRLSTDFICSADACLSVVLEESIYKA